MSTFNYNYDNQIKHYILQVMAIFASMEIQHDDGEMQRVHIRYANADRTAESILAGNTQNALLPLPMFTVTMSDIELAPDRKKGTGTIRRNLRAEPGALASEVEFVEQKQPMPYNFVFDVTFMASNLQHDFQIVEQILTLFDPILQIQTSDSRYDPAAITTITLNNVDDQTETIIGTERRIIKRNYNFTVAGWLSSPAIRVKNLIERIQVNLYSVTNNIEEINLELFENADLLDTITIGQKTCE